MCSVLLLIYFGFNGIYVSISISVSVSVSVYESVPASVSVATSTSISISLSLSIFKYLYLYTWISIDLYIYVSNSHKPYECKLYTYFMRNVLVSTLSYCERRGMRRNLGVFIYFAVSKVLCILCNPGRVVIYHIAYDLCYFLWTCHVTKLYTRLHI